MNPLLWRDTLMAPDDWEAWFERNEAPHCQVCGSLRGEYDPVSSDLLCSRCRVRYSVARWLVWGER